jgi:flagellar biosynthesis protein FlhA
MASLQQTILSGRLNAVTLQALGAPILVVLLLAMMVLPLPPFALVFIFTFNIALSLVVLLASVYIR